MWAGGGRPRPGWTSGGDMAESVLGTVQKCEPLSCPCLARSSLPPGVWRRPQILGEGGGLCKIWDWACLWECLSMSLSLFFQCLSISISVCASLFISLFLSICFTLRIFLCSCVFYMSFSLSASPLICLYPDLPVCASLSPCLCVSLSLLWVFLSAFLCPGTW